MNKRQYVQDIFAQLTPKEVDLFKQLNAVNIEGLDNAFADFGGKSYTQKQAYNTMLNELSDVSKEKVEKLYYENVGTGTVHNDPTKPLHMDSMRSTFVEIEVHEMFEKIKPELKPNEMELFVQLNKANAEVRKNQFREKRPVEEFVKYDNLKKSYPVESVDKVETLYYQNIEGSHDIGHLLKRDSGSGPKVQSTDVEIYLTKESENTKEVSDPIKSYVTVDQIQEKINDFENENRSALPLTDDVLLELDTKIEKIEELLENFHSALEDPKITDAGTKEEFQKLIDQLKNVFKTLVQEIKDSITNKVDGVKNDFNSLITDKVQSINDKFKALSNSIDAKFPDPAREAVEKQEPAKEAAQAVEKQEPAKEAAQAVEKQGPVKEAAQAVEKQGPVKEAAQAVEKQGPVKEEIAELNAEINSLKRENTSLKALFTTFQKSYPDEWQDVQNKTNKKFEAKQTQSKDQDIQKPTQKVTTIKSESISL
ncbi:hypothetical protein H9S87_18595 (plasmid) [Bacillus pumilus]|uniref:hypothetical protein n=1 Tax=Bacillus pumilus TaxID=1408 RepID=UPI0016585DA1|nr:hypothetical protein [Bacillus pumilus]QNP18294.1 hypothetical protein H9S87_18595 [Bacillus pumilus]